MLRNLLYSIFFHVFFFVLLLLGSVNFDRPSMFQTEVAPLTISFIDEESLKDVKKNTTSKIDSRVANLSLDEKVSLYDKIKKQKLMKDYDKSSTVVAGKGEGDSSNNVNLANVDNEFSYYYTPIYVAESKVNTQEKLKIIENRLKKEELRKKLKERNAVPEPDIGAAKQFQELADIIAISQKPVVVKKKKVEDKRVAVAEPKKVEVSVKEDVNVDTKVIEYDSDDIAGLVNEITFSNIEIDEKFEGVKEDEIFTPEDYKTLSQIGNNKVDIRYLLTLREKRNIQKQIKGCYKMAIIRSGKDSKSIVNLTVRLNSDGTIILNSVRVNNIENTKSYNIALDNAKSALVFCSPLRGLPQGKYQSWRNLGFIFDSSNLE